MWHGRRRMRQLELEIAEARAQQAALQQRVDLFEKIAAAAGASLDDAPRAAAAAGGAGGPVPATLLAAASQRRERGSPVRLAVGEADVIAVIGDEGGDPREWWAVIRRLGSGAS